MNKYKIKKGGKAFLYLVLTAILVAGISIYSAIEFSQKTNAADVRTNATIHMPEKLIVGGESFGVKFFTKGVVVVGINDIQTEDGAKNPARDAGIQEKDIILKIDGQDIDSNEQISEVISGCTGKPVEILYQRNGTECTACATPQLDKDSGEYKLGIWVRDSTAGIGTITFFDPENKTFGALGHGICDIDTGVVMPLRYADIFYAEIHTVKKGESGNPGELKGNFVDDVKMGNLFMNSEEGIFGTIDDSYQIHKTAVEIGKKNEIKEGPATIFCSIDQNGIREYSVEIVKITHNAKQSTKNLLIKVTDPELIKATGGIVQGMSGSPILQNGKIIGAVTHVLVNEPLMGYGIFIENMLEEMSA